MKPDTVCAVLATALLCCAAPIAAAMFPDPTLVAPTDSFAAARADFDLDGRADLALGGFQSTYLAVFFGNGDGSFAETRLAATRTDALAVGDFNEDGLPDLVASSGPHNALVLLVWLGNGDRTFGSPTSYTLDNVPKCTEVGQCGPVPCPWCYLPTIDVGDIDEDGHQDLVVGDSKWNWSDVPPLIVIRGGHSILFGYGNGSFGGVVGQRDGSGMLAALGDFDGDRHLDLAVEAERCIEGIFCDETPPLDVFAGDGTGAFAAAGEVPGIAGACDVTVVDHDGDGLDDVVATSSGNLVLVRSSSAGGFLAPASFAAGPSPCRIETADFDGDGLRDLVVGNGTGRQGSLLPGNAGGTLDPALAVPAVHEVSLLVADDYDENGSTDLAIVSNPEHTLSIRHGRGDLTFRPTPRRRVFPLGGSARGLVAADLDLDGNLDVAAARAPAAVTILRGDGTGNLSSVGDHAVGSEPLAIAVGRVNSADATPDLVVLNTSDVSVLLGVGPGDFLPEIRVTVDPDPKSIALGDFNGDGAADLAVAHGSPTNVVVVRLARGDGTFGGGRAQPVGVDPRHLATADLDGDGYLDLVAANRGSADLSILRGAVGGSFLAETRVPVGGAPTRVAIGDLDGDARLDLVVSQGGVTVLRGNGDGSFGPASTLDLGDNYRNALAISHFDGDGRADLVGWGARSNAATVLLGDGAFAFEALGSFGVPGIPTALARGDLDADGRDDLVAGTADSFVAVLVNAGPTTLGFAPDKSTLGWPYVDDAASYEVYRGALADLVDGDGDGQPDAGYGTCQTVNGPDGNEWIELGDPPPAVGFFYLVASVDELGLRDLGTTSAGLPRLPTDVCP